MDNYIVTQQKVTDTLETNYMPYAMSVIVSRAIPEIDGFKPSHRKLLYTMYKMGLIGGNRTKSANVVGQTMKLNPHGDAAIYETMVRLTRGNGALMLPLVDSKGNFGKVYSRDMAYAAARYTEVKLEDICKEVFADIDKDNVDFVDNYDGTMKEPVLLPTTFPNILANPNQGIAVGMASNICSFNLTELCKTTIEYIKDKNHDIITTLVAPDFSTGAQIIYNEAEMRAIYETGRGSFRMRAKYRFDKDNRIIEVYEIPYTTTIEAIIDKIIDLVKKGDIKEITDVRDETDLKGLKLAIDVKKGTDVEKLMAKLYKMTPLQDSFGCNFNILVDGYPRLMGVKEILDAWIDFRMQCIRRQVEYDHEKKVARLHLLEGLRKILLDIDKAVEIVRNTEHEHMVVPNLMAGFDIDEVQAEFVAEIKLRNFNREYILKHIAEIDGIKEEIDDLEDILASRRRVKQIIIKDLERIIKKYGAPRKTMLIAEDDIEVYSEEADIEDYNLKIFLTKQNYLKKISLVSLRSGAEQKLKEDDVIICEQETQNIADLILFSDMQNVYKIRINDIPDCKASSMGEYLPNIIGMEKDENIIYAVATTDYSGNILFAFDNGKMAKITLASYATKTNRKKLANAYYANAQLVDIRFMDKEEMLVALSSSNKALVFSTDKINAKTTRTSMGVAVLSLKKGDKLARVETVDNMGFEDYTYYQTKNIPSKGFFIKESDMMKQMSLLE